MSRICVIGSINVDIVFSVERIARPGETIASSGARKFPGGKGQNQAIALRRAYPDVAMAGNIGEGDGWIVEALDRQGIDTSMVRRIDGATGTAFIQVDGSGQNCIVLDKGANHRFDREQVDSVLSCLHPEDLVVLQNEINLLEYILRAAAARGIPVAFNPSPFERSIGTLPLRGLRYLILNEIEGEGLAGSGDPGEIITRLSGELPETTIVLTLGVEGAMCRAPGHPVLRVGGRKVRAVDTTAAGDTFTGYFLAEAMRGRALGDALETANLAASISVTRAGAASSIPERAEVEASGAA